MKRGLLSWRNTGTVLILATQSACVGGNEPSSPQLIPKTIAAVSLTSQTTVAGAPVSALASVKVTAANGAPVPGVTVVFAVVSGGGTLAGATQTTDAAGIATAGAWTLGTTVGANTVTATVSGLPTVTFSATAVAGSPASVTKIPGGDNQSVVAGTPVTVAPSVLVQDANSNAVSGVTVTFAATGANGTVTGAISVTDAQGIAAVGSWILGPTAGVNAVTAAVSGLPPVTFSATAVAGGPVRITKLPDGDNQSRVAGGPVAIVPSVLVQDANLNAVPGVTVTFTVTGGYGMLTGVASVTDAQGIAAVGSWTLGPTAGVNTITATISGVLPVTFSATGVPGSPARVNKLPGGDNQSVMAGTSVAIAPSVVVQDAYLNPVPGVTVTFAVTEGNGTVTGSALATNAQGIATVGSWTLGPMVGVGWTFPPTAGANALTATISGIPPLVFSASAKPDYEALLYKGQVAAGWTGDPRAFAIAVHKDGSVLSAIPGTGPAGVGGAVLTVHDGTVVTVMTDASGLPTNAVFNGVLVLFRNYTATTVDLGIIHADKTIDIVRGVPFDRSYLLGTTPSTSLRRLQAPSALNTGGASPGPAKTTVTPFTVTPAALFGIDLHDVLSFTGHLVEAGACAAGVAAAGLASGGLLAVGAAAGCAGTIVTLVNGIVPGDQPSLIESGAALVGIPSIYADAAHCLGQSRATALPCVAALAGVAFLSIAAMDDEIEDSEEVASAETQLGVPSADYELSLTPTSLTISPGAASATFVTLTRTNFTGAVTLGLDGAPAGVSGLFTPAAPTGTDATLTVSIGAGVAPGVYNLTVTGTGTAGNHSTPLTLIVGTGVARFAMVSAGSRHACGLTLGGAAYCWGWNLVGQLGIGDDLGRLGPNAVVGGITFASLSAGSGQTCGVTPSGAAYCWGRGDFVGDGGPSFPNRLAPTPVAGGLTFASVSAGGDHTCGVTTSGAAYCWGDNSFGRLGDGTTTARLVPTLVAGGLTFASVSAGGGNTCGVTTNGTAYCWGYNLNGGLGNGSFGGESWVPTKVAGSLAFASVSPATDYTCGVTTSGEAYCWGEGVGGPIAVAVPTPIAAGLRFALVSAAGASLHACGVTTGGAAYCWGVGGLGNGTTEGAFDPTLVFGSLTFGSVSAGDSYFSCGVTLAGTAYCWGDNQFGQLGDGTVTNRLVPTAVIP